MENKDKQAEFFIKENAYIKLKGNFTFKDAEGNVIPTGKEVYICRCGASANMPFCDGAHKKVGVKR